MTEKKMPPCMLNCPAHINIREVLNFIKQKKFLDAINLVKENLPLPASIARICPHPCEFKCTRKFKDGAINIHQIRIFLADMFLNNKFDFEIKENVEPRKKICVIGAGPAGISCAYFLSLYGHKIFVFDQMSESGGMLKYGVPEYRLPKKILNREINFFDELEIDFIGNMKVDKKKFNELKNKFDAIILAIGAWKAKKIKCVGEENFYDGIEFLRNIKVNKKEMEELVDGKKIAVIGGGNTAIDVCRSAIRLNAKEVINIYRRTKNEMPAEISEINDAIDEGVIFQELLSPAKILLDDENKKILFMEKYKLGEKDFDGRASIIKTNEILTEKFDLIILAVGQDVEADFFEGEKNIDGTIKINDCFETSEKKIFCIGDAIRNKNRIAINAIADAKKVCEHVNNFLLGKELVGKEEIDDVKTNNSQVKNKFRSERLEMKKRKACERKKDFDEIILSWSEKEFLQEASRCLNCRGCKKNDCE